jgi:hypothetical protein
LRTLAVSPGLNSGYEISPITIAPRNANAAQIIRTFSDRVSPIGLPPSAATAPVAFGLQPRIYAQSSHKKSGIRIGCCQNAEKFSTDLSKQLKKNVSLTHSLFVNRNPRRAKNPNFAIFENAYFATRMSVS